MSQYNDTSNPSTNASDYSDMDQYYAFRPPVAPCQSTVSHSMGEKKYFNENRKTNYKVMSNQYRLDYDGLSGRVPMKLSSCPGEQMYQLKNAQGQSNENLDRARMRISDTYPSSMGSARNSGFFNLQSAYEDR
jgi:hypothetical protein